MLERWIIGKQTRTFDWRASSYSHWQAKQGAYDYKSAKTPVPAFGQIVRGNSDFAFKLVAQVLATALHN